MNGWRVVISKLRDNPEAKEKYNMEQSEEVYDKKVENLDLKAVIATINGLQEKAE